MELESRMGEHLSRFRVSLHLNVICLLHIWMAFSLCLDCVCTDVAGLSAMFPHCFQSVRSVCSHSFQCLPTCFHPLRHCFGRVSLVKSRRQTRSLQVGVIVPKGSLQEKLLRKWPKVTISVTCPLQGTPSRDNYTHPTF